MSTSCFSYRSRPSWPKPISSAMLDKLMSPSNKTDDEKSFSPSKMSAGSSSEPKLNSALQFTPTQLYKTGRANYTGSSESKKLEFTSSSSETSCSTPVSSSTPSETETLKSESSTLNPESKSFEPRSQNTSVYETPDSTPTALKIPTVLSRPHSKRSLINQYDEDYQCSSDSSLNCSYYTPDSSPGEYESSLKRLKTRWSLPVSLHDTNNTEYMKESYSGPLFTCDKVVFQPELIGYQLVGDSQFCRFGQQLLGLERVAMPNSSGRIGICVSGQTISDLHRRVKEKMYPISDKIILMIGTNDFLRSMDVMTMCKELSELIKTLQETVTNIVLLTLPPIPKLEKKQNTLHFSLLEKYNSFIRSLENGEKLRIADISPLYMSCPPYQRCRMHLFELFFAGPARRYDLIHLNRQGLEVIRKYILDNFL